jgi:hypothetical protein
MCSFIFRHYWPVFLQGWFRKWCGSVKWKKVTLEAFFRITRHKGCELMKNGVKRTQAPVQSDTTNKCLISFETFLAHKVLLWPASVVSIRYSLVVFIPLCIIIPRYRFFCLPYDYCFLPVLHVSIKKNSYEF